MIREQSAINTFALKMAAIRIAHEKAVIRDARIEKLYKAVLALAVLFFFFAPFMAGCSVIPKCHPPEVVSTGDGFTVYPDPCDGLGARP